MAVFTRDGLTARIAEVFADYDSLRDGTILQISCRTEDYLVDNNLYQDLDTIFHSTLDFLFSYSLDTASERRENLKSNEISLDLNSSRPNADILQFTLQVDGSGFPVDTAKLRTARPHDLRTASYALFRSEINRLFPTLTRAMTLCEQYSGVLDVQLLDVNVYGRQDFAFQIFLPIKYFSPLDDAALRAS